VFDFQVAQTRKRAQQARVLEGPRRSTRGVIRAGDGTVLARSVKQQGGVYHRTIPDRPSLFFPRRRPTSFTDIGQAGLETVLQTTRWWAKRQGLDTLFDPASAAARKGRATTSSLTPRPPTRQRIAVNAPCASTGDGKGAVVAMDPHTGAVKVMASDAGV